MEFLALECKTPIDFLLEPSLFGPAMPVTASAKSAPVLARAPSAISRATASLTAPWAASVSARTPRKCSFAALL